MGLKGIVSKRLSAPYVGGPDWITQRSRPSPVRARISVRSKLGEPAQDGKYELAVRRRGVGPCVLERAEVAAAIRNSTERLPFDR
jgi:hypothetical protein